MDILFVLAFCFMLISSLATVLSEANKKKKNSDLTKKLDEIYKRAMQENKNSKKPKNIKTDEKVKKIGNLEKHYDEAISDDYKAKADDYFSDRSRELDEYLSRDIKDRLREFKAKKTEEHESEHEEMVKVEENVYEDFDYEHESIQFSQTNVAKAIIMKEILDKPLALRRINE
ncbi:hypothetical protein [Fenollaria sporofastidiosus]|uniref:hypothetical protein n=1 Tax=Fenollaria sporofastidiosus TaxID=2811778 RepID=UPI001C0014BC|nr:hypothetical protein [Fenollaria sporofastidiosus]